MGKVQIVVGGQYGSEGKGAVAGYLASLESDLLAIRTGGPNAGHTVYDERDERWALRQIPAAAVTNPTALLAISAGSEVDPAVLQSEGDLLEKWLPSKLWHRLVIDSQATVIETGHASAEAALVQSIGSTGKGIGAARSDRIMRTAKVWVDTLSDQEWFGMYHMYGKTGNNVARLARQMLSQGATVQIEAAQGFGLGLHAGLYPQCTSSDCRAIDALAAVGISPWDPVVEEVEVWVVLRVYPIRVAGNSGPMKGETSWAELGLPEEVTTVTRKIRRVGEWDQDLADAAIEANGGYGATRIALMMFDQVAPLAGGIRSWKELGASEQKQIDEWKDRLGGRIALVGTGPRSIIDLREKR